MINGREKGHAYERHVANVLRALFGETLVKRGYQYNAVDHPPDIVTPLVSVECKIGKRWQPYQALDQAHRDVVPNTFPILVARHDRQPSLAIMDFELFLLVMGELWDLINTAPQWRRDSFWASIFSHVAKLKEKARASIIRSNDPLGKRRGRGYLRGQKAKARQAPAGPRHPRRRSNPVDCKTASTAKDKPGRV